MVTENEGSMPETNLHACCVVVDGSGVLITGGSGAGKTSLALGLVEACRLRNVTCGFVSDDQVLLSARNGCLFARAPHTIAGKVEIRGFGVTDIVHQGDCCIAMICELVEDGDIERMPAPLTEQVMGICVPKILVPKRHEAGSVRILLAKLGISL